ncbi:MAG: ABC transporter permease, partial [Pseudomonadota bacterium]
MIWLWGALAFWAVAWAFNAWLANSRFRTTLAVRIAIPIIFGITLLVVWEGLVRAFDVSPVILPAPSRVAETFAASTDILWLDFRQTVLKGALRGFAMGAVAAILVAILIDRSSFLTRGLLPIGNFVAALPIVG